MSKKDFIALANAMRANKPVRDLDMGRQDQWWIDCNVIADVCAAMNPAFKRDRWLSYIQGECGPNGGVKGGKR